MLNVPCGCAVTVNTVRVIQTKRTRSGDSMTCAVVVGCIVDRILSGEGVSYLSGSLGVELSRNVERCVKIAVAGRGRNARV